MEIICSGALVHIFSQFVILHYYIMLIFQCQPLLSTFSIFPGFCAVFAVPIQLLLGFHFFFYRIYARIYISF